MSTEKSNADSIEAQIPQQQQQQQLRQEHPWKIWTAADALDAKSSSFYPNLTPRVVQILRDEWTQFVGQPEWRSLLDKRTLQHELEESIVAISLYEEQLKNNTQQPHIVVDVCAGKGLYSFLLSYLRPPHLISIVMIEKAAINWYHILAVNAIHDGRPRIEIWDKTNLHEYDRVLTRMLALPQPLVLSGIHLCKQLGPAFCGLVNGLGDKCLMSCLAPCCLPRVVTTQGKKWQKYKQKDVQPFQISIPMKEEPSERESRLDYMERRRRVKKNPLYSEMCPTKGTGGTVCCYFCQGPGHSVVDCALLKELDETEQIKVRQAAHAALVPCWNCLEMGHVKSDCPVAMVRRNAQSPPVLTLDLTGILSNDQPADEGATITNPFERYCQLLSTSIQDREYVQVMNAPLESSSASHDDQEESNWNKDRKACFIVAGIFTGHCDIVAATYYVRVSM